MMLEPKLSRIAIPSKGRLQEPSENLLKAAGIKFRRRERALFAHADGLELAVLFVRPDGAVVRETAVMNASVLAEFARGVLDEASPAAKQDEPRTGDRLAHAEALLRRGELALAEKLLGDDASPRGHWLRARLFVQRRQGERSLAELHAARRGSESLEPDITADEAVVRMRMGQLAEAKAAFEEFEHKWPEHARVPECWF
ncbi:MAG: hypothetical protein HYR85_18425 [Planctomycetes bacterium]|nr:hypothetical protein [Planctomycetota bacterium]